MPYLLDTCIISELRKPHCNPGVASWMTGIEPDEVFLSVVTLGEIRKGIEILRPKDPRTAGALERWLVGLDSHYGERILSVSAAVADRWGRISPAQPIPVSDGLIAATGLEYKLTVVTRNVSDFERSGVGTLNPYS